MQEHFRRWLYKLLLFFFAIAENAFAVEVSISGQIFKVEYKVPSFIANPPFGWYLSLDEQSKKKLHKFQISLPKEIQEFYKEFDFSIVRLCSSPIKLIEGKTESFRGIFGSGIPLDGPDCFDFYIIYEERFKGRESRDDYEFYPNLFSAQEFPSLTSEQEQQEVELIGTVRFQIFPGPGNGCSIEGGDSVERCWYVTVESAQVPHTWQFPDLLGEKITIDWVKDENLIDQKVVVRGTLFNAHTSHHHTSLLMDMKSIQRRNNRKF